MNICTAWRAHRGRLVWLLVCLIWSAASQLHAQTAPAWASVQRTSTATSAALLKGSIAIAADGSQYVTGMFDGTLTLGSVTLTAGTGTVHMFLAKYSPAGTVLWATKLDGGGPQNYFAMSGNVAVDGAGNAYVVGFFTASLTVGSFSLTSPADSYVVKFNAQGVPQWALPGGSSNSYAAAVAVDASGNAVVVGACFSPIAFGGTPLAGGGVYCFKISPTGTVVQVTRTGSSSFLTPTAIALDGGGNVCITGYIEGRVTFGTTTLTSAGERDIFVAKLDAAGNPLWAQRAGGLNTDIAQGLALDAAGDMVVCGTYDYNSNTMPQNQGTKLYLARFTQQGAAVWSRLVAPTGSSLFSNQATSVVNDGRGGYFMSGNFKGTAAFGTTALSAANDQLFVARYDSQGNAIWASQGVGTASDQSYCYGIAADAAGSIFLTGAAVGSVAFGSFTTTGTADTFVAKLTAGGTLTAARTAASALALQAYPNPASGTSTVVLPVGGGQLELLDALGRTVRRQALPATAGACPVAVAGLAAGLYQLRATLGNGQVAQARLQVE